MAAKDVGTEEIDLVELIQIIWDGKWKIVIATILSTCAMFGYQLTQPETNFTSKTDIRPLGLIEAEYYEAFNDLGIFEITPDLLQNLYLDELQSRSEIKKVVEALGFFEKNAFPSEKDYDDAVRKFITSIVIEEPSIEADQRGDDNGLASISFTHHDEQLLLRTLEVVDQSLNEVVRQSLIKRFDIAILNRKQERAYKLSELDAEIERAFSTYDRQTQARLSFLQEQADIARAIGSANNTLQSQVFETPSGIVTNFDSDTPFYLRGYQAIEKEIELIRNRTDKEPFIKNLVTLERQKQQAEQDMTLEQGRLLFQLTPVVNEGAFVAMSMSVPNTEFVYGNMKRLLLIFSVLFGGFAGVVLVILSSAMNARSMNKRPEHK